MLSFGAFLEHVDTFTPAKLRTLMNTTDSPRRTKFILPDGTRLQGSGEHRDMCAPYDLSTVLKAGVVRYRYDTGIECQSRMTDIQSRIVADDWNTEDHGDLVVDVGAGMNDAQWATMNFKRFATPINASAVRNFVNGWF